MKHLILLLDMLDLELASHDMCDHYCKHAASDISMETLQDICSKCPLNKLVTEERKKVMKECRKVLKEL